MRATCVQPLMRTSKRHDGADALNLYVDSEVFERCEGPRRNAEGLNEDGAGACDLQCSRVQWIRRVQ
jgi:hypothetical protein